MTHQACNVRQSKRASAVFTKGLISTLPLRAGMSTLLLASSGMSVLSAEVNAPSVPDRADTKQLATRLVVAQTPTISVPTSPTGNDPVSQPGTNLQTPTAPPPATTNATVIYVNSKTGANSGSAGTEAAPYKTITYALNQAQPGTVIQLAPGYYNTEIGEVFPLVIKSGVTLRGDESTKGQSIEISGGGRYVSPTFARQDVAVLAEKDSTIAGVTITNSNTRGTGLWIESTNPTVRNNTFINNNRDGIFVTGTATPLIEANLFTKNGGNGISVARSAQGEIRNNQFIETGFGLAIGGNSSPLVVNNQIKQNEDGLYISESARPVLRGNTIQDNARDGVVATINAQPDLGTEESAGENLIRNNKRYDVYNATRGNILVAIGNDIDRQRISGSVDFLPAQVAFSDVQGLWAQPYIKALAAKRIIAGFPDGTFKPNEPVTRAQFAAIVSKAFTPQPQRPVEDFQDVSRKFWGYQAIQTAYQGGFVAGYPGGVFQPQQPIPRVQVLVSLANGLKLNPDNPKAISVYADAAQIPNYATGPVAAATQRQLVVNYPTPSQLNPNREATRAEVAAFVYQALVNAGRAEAIPSPYIVSVP